MELGRYFPSRSQRPVATTQAPHEVLFDRFYNAFNVDNGMALEDLRQSICQMAGQALAGTLMQANLEGQVVVTAARARQRHVIGSLLGIAQERFKKTVRLACRPNFIKYHRGKDFLANCGVHGSCLLTIHWQIDRYSQV